MEKDPRFEIWKEEIVVLLRELGAFIGHQCPEGWGFALEIFEFEGESFFYISNAEREDMIKALRKFINREQ